MNGALIIVAVVVFAGAAILITSPQTINFNHMQDGISRQTGNPLSIVTIPTETPAPQPAAQAAPGARLKAPAQGTSLAYHNVTRHTKNDQVWIRAIVQARTDGRPGRIQFITTPPQSWNYGRCDAGSECMAVYDRPVTGTTVQAAVIYDDGRAVTIDTFEG